MFTVCPKCALTLVVTAQDLRVAQGYVRCGRCSNVFNAIVGLTDDRGALAGQAAGSPGTGGSTAPATASTSIMRKAPSIDDALADPLADTGETEAVYAEPDADEVKFQEVFIEPPPPPSTPTRGPVKFVAPPPGPPPRAVQEPPKRASDPERRYSDTEGIETYPENELEFNPNVTDVTKVFVEAAPVTFRNNAATGQFEKIVLGSDGELVRPPAQTAPPPTTNKAAPQPPRPATPSPPPRPIAPPPAPPPPPAQTSAPAVAKAPPAPAPQPDRIDVTASRPAAKFQAANDEEIESETGAATAPGSFARSSGFVDDDDDDDGVIGDIYAKAKPRPPAPRNTTLDTGRNTGGRRAGIAANVADSTATMALPSDAEMAIGSAEPITTESAPRNRFMLWVAGAAVLSVVLVVQTIHHNRHDLATNAFLNRPLTKLYGALGIPLVPNWDLTKYDVRQLGASTSEASSGTLTVRASLKNTATQPLPLPLLRIVMQDRYGNRVATRDVPPTGYVPGAVPAEAHLGVGQRIDAEMTFKDPGQDAVGFEIDACLPTASGRITCANDAAVASR